MIYLFLKVFLILSLLFPVNAQAYIDPGMGSFILQAILGFIAVTITSVTFFWNKIKSIIKNIFKKKNNQKNDDKVE
tara:strand:+ start:2850 stop:3077 length:228 start_codon:yes stop_codon:yes gene_type:complete